MYLQIRDKVVVSEYFDGLGKNRKIKINQWIEELDKVIVNAVLKKNRNHHIKLIQLMC